MKRRVVPIVVVSLLIGAVLLWWSPWSSTQRARIAGVVAGVPQAEAESESVLREALEAAREEAQRRGARAFIVHRRGHRIFEHYAGRSGASMVEGGALGAAVLRLALHQPEDEQADITRAATLVSERLWLPLRAGDAWLSAPSGVAPTQCCIEAQIDDWMRVGDLLNGHGAYLGERIVSADDARQLLAGHELVWRGDEPLLARDGTAFDLQDGVRLWLAPRRALTMLVWTDEEQAGDTLLANIILRGLNDASPAIGGDVSDLVPGH